MPKQHPSSYDILVAARYQNSKGFKALIEKASREAINQALVFQAHKNTNRETALQEAARYQNSEGFKALIEKASREAINQALVLPDTHGWTALHAAAYYQNQEGFKALIERASPEAINQALALQNNNQWSALESQTQEGFKVLIEKASVYAVCTALLKNRNFENVKKCNINLITSKTSSPLVLKILNDPHAIKSHTKDFIALHKMIFNNELNQKDISLNDCNQWLKFLNEALVFAPDEQTRNLVEASCMYLNWIASFKTKDESGKKNFKENAIAHMSKITSPIGLSIADNYLVFELYKMQSEKTINVDELFLRQIKINSVNELVFLHQAAVDMHTASLKGKTIDQPACMHLLSIVNATLGLDSNLDPNKENWTEEDEEKYKKALYLIQAEEYLKKIELFILSCNSEIINENEMFKELNKELMAALIETRKSIAKKEPDDIDKQLNNFSRKSLLKVQTLMTTITDDLSRKKQIAFLKNLAICLITIPLLGAGLIYVGAWTNHYIKHKEHLLFHPVEKEKIKKLHDKLPPLPEWKHKKN